MRHFVGLAFALSTLTAFAATPQQVLQKARQLTGDTCDARLEAGQSAADLVQSQGFRTEGLPYIMHVVTCAQGAYTKSQVILNEAVWDQGKMSLVQLAEAKYNAQYNVTGYGTTAEVYNAKLSADGKFVSHVVARSIGDSFSRATYQLENGEFVLKLYEADQSFDGQVTSREVFRAAGYRGAAFRGN